MSILDQINQDKQAQVDRELAGMVEESVNRLSTDTRVPKDFLSALRSPGVQVIAEVKKASPSKGVIRPDFDPVSIAKSYEAAGAACLSILTEEKYFQGSIEYLKAIRAVVDLPILRKDFIVDARQVRETYDMGADALLLIVAGLGDDKLKEFYDLATSFGLSVLVEVHDQPELERAMALGAQLIGVNNRNLKTFKTRLQTSFDLKTQMPESVVAVSESGISGYSQVQEIEQAGFEGILVGESLMRQPDPGAALRTLKGLDL